MARKLRLQFSLAEVRAKHYRHKKHSISVLANDSNDIQPELVGIAAGIPESL